MAIVIRRAEPADYGAVQQILAGPKAIWGTCQLPFPSAESWRKRLAEPAEGVFNLVACVEGEVIGQLVLSTAPHSPRRRHVGQIAMAVRDDWQGKGAGTALMQAAVDLAEKWLNLCRLELEVYTDNEPAIRLYDKFGFKIEGTKVGFAFRDGQYVDAYMMARLREQSTSPQATSSVAVNFQFQEPGPLCDGDLELVLVEQQPGDPARSHVPAYQFEMRRTGSQERIGYINLRIGDTLHLRMYAGHIGYQVEPAYRSQRYAARACRLLLPLARLHGLHELWITCNPGNWASRRTCELAGAELVDIVELPEDTDMYQRGERQKCRYRLVL